MRTFFRILAPLLTLGLFAGGCGGNGSKTTFVTIGTGGVTGVYYPAGGAVAKIVNSTQDQHGVRVSVESTGGSVYNINAVLSGDLQFGISQSDRHFQAWHGRGEWDGKPQAGLRSVLSLHQEAVTLVAAEESRIQALGDLIEKRVNIGNPGSGNRGNALEVLTAAGLNPEEDLQVEGLKASEAPRMLQDGRLDAFFYTVGHPSGAIKESTSGRRKVRFIPITGMDALLEASPYYSVTRIPSKYYPMAANEGDTPTIGMVTTLVTSSEVPEHAVYAVTKEVFEQLDTFRSMHPALADLDPDNMRTGLTAPLHPGAERYYRERGWLP